VSGVRAPEAAGGKPLVFVVVGTRPEAIKMAPVLRALRARGSEIESRLVLTGQHDTLVSLVLDAFDLEADHDLAIMRPDQTLYQVGEACMRAMGSLLRDERPSEILVQGDTATVFFASLAAFFEGVQVGHVEAGLRSHRKRSPFPEEMFRRLTDVLADQYFAPTQRSVDHLVSEGIPEDRVHLTGNPVVDALEGLGTDAEGPGDARVRDAMAAGHRMVLLTAHRRESFGPGLEAVFHAVAELTRRYPDVRVIYPVHPNPNVREPATRILGGLPGVVLTEPLGYLDLVRVMKAAALVLTDSGGIQEEAPTFGVPVLVLREVTERPEGVEAGVATLVGTDRDRILAVASELLDREGGAPGAARPSGPNPYGDGRAGIRIADIVISGLTEVPRRTGDWDGVSLPAAP
jgi:UDP-N-acetylglucosamine 2-epimerase (non-hydrolysing)